MHLIITVTLAKSIANGFPMGAVVTTPEIANVLTRAGHFNTFGHNPVTAAAASAVLDVRTSGGSMSLCLWSYELHSTSYNFVSPKVASQYKYRLSTRSS